MTATRVTIAPSVDHQLFVTRRQLAARHHTTAGVLANEASAGRPRVPVYRFGSKVMHRLSDVEAYERQALANA